MATLKLIPAARAALVLVTLSPSITAQDSAMVSPAAANSRLIGELTKELGVTPAQAAGGAGALFGLAKSRLNPADFSKVAASVPGIDSLIDSAPAAPANGLPGLSGNSASFPEAPGGAGGLAALEGSFRKLGMSPEMISRFVPVLTKFVWIKGGPDAASLLAGAPH